MAQQVQRDVREGVRDAYNGMQGYIGPTRWAKPYFSNHYHENPETKLGMLGHVNCGYLSTPGRPPTLEALKQHAQSLTYLISTLAPSSTSAEVDNQNNPRKPLGAGSFLDHQAYDWLNNLQVPYDNIDVAHRRPLNSLTNLVNRSSDDRGVEFHCPMETTRVQYIEQGSNREDLERERPTYPFSTHMTLLMHANECLERLDHEYSALGGLLSILPTGENTVNEHAELDKAKQTLVGQWLLYTQHLVSRMHELEIAYSNSLDLLATEAMVPAQHMSMLGPDERSGREIVYPQDQWILANAGEDVSTFINQLLDRKETYMEAQDEVFLRQRVVGDTLRTEDQDRLRGIVHVDLNTRFYRLKRGGGRSPIFVLPAFSDRSNTANTREMENRPTVVTLATPSYPNRVSAYDKRSQEIQDQALGQRLQVTNLEKEITNLRQAEAAGVAELTRLRAANAVYEDSLGNDQTQVVQRVVTAEQARDEAQARIEEAEREQNRLREELNEYKQAEARRQRLPTSPQVQESQDADGNPSFVMNQTAWEIYANRSQAVDAAKASIASLQSTLEALDTAGHIDTADFAWMQELARVA
ncbi:hypothetical protein F4819DRAFT_392357 [Hypoxylon fuscum]|nr:hypothetical protein F4819DRAFT_392357 [Hypoxylon fuscum]